MSLSALRVEVTERFHEVDTYLSALAAAESPDPVKVPDGIDVRIMRGLFFVHLYGAFEYAMNQAFIRVAQHISAHPVKLRHLEKVIFSVAMDGTFESMRSATSWDKKLPKRIEFIQMMTALDAATVPDNILSAGMMSCTTAVISTAFKVYGIKDNPLVDPAIAGYVNEVFERRCAVAHGRESPVKVGVVRAVELRKRYDALYRQSAYVLDSLDEFMKARKFVSSRYRSAYI